MVHLKNVNIEEGNTSENIFFLAVLRYPNMLCEIIFKKMKDAKGNHAWEQF